MVVERVRELGITAHAQGRSETRQDRVAVEEPLEIRVDGRPFSVIMRTPGHDLELAAGFLHAEGLLESPEELALITHCPELEHGDNVVEVRLGGELGPARVQGRAERATVVSSSCGVCGRRTLEEATSRAPAFSGSPPRYPAELITALPARLALGQEVFDLTGGLHGAALFGPEGTALVIREDVGRHNAVDKVIGERLLSEQWPLEETLLVVSGRAGFEIVDKALMARIQTVISVSAPSSLAVELAQRANMNLFGFVRGESLNVYAGELGRSQPR